MRVQCVAITNIPLLYTLVCRGGFVVGNVKHFEKESEVLNVVGVVVVVDGEPEHGVCFGVLVSNDAVVHAGRDENGGLKGSGSLGGDQSEVIVSLHVFFFEFVEIFDTLQTQFFHILLDLGWDKIGNRRRRGFAILVGGN